MAKVRPSPVFTQKLAWQRFVHHPFSKNQAVNRGYGQITDLCQLFCPANFLRMRASNPPTPIHPRPSVRPYGRWSSWSIPLPDMANIDTLSYHSWATMLYLTNLQSIKQIDSIKLYCNYCQTTSPGNLETETPQQTISLARSSIFEWRWWEIVQLRGFYHDYITNSQVWGRWYPCRMEPSGIKWRRNGAQRRTRWWFYGTWESAIWFRGTDECARILISKYKMLLFLAIIICTRFSP